MKRDMDLVRRILMEVERSDGPLDARDLLNGHESLESVIYHITIMQEGGLLSASVERDMNGICTDAVIANLTWEGQDFLANVRSDSVWHKAKKTIAQKLGDASFSVLSSLASKIASEMVL